MDRIFDSFREATQEAARMCREHKIGASLERRDRGWAIVFDRSPLDSASQPESDPTIFENLSLKAELREAKHELASLKNVNEDLRSNISVLEQEHILVKPLLTRHGRSPFLQSVLDKAPEENARAIRRYEYLFILSELGEIEQSAFDNFKVASGLWIAIHNYEKVKAGPQRIHVPDRPRPAVERCTSCGGIVSDGHCRCSD